jgi:hypothetical protein
MTWSTSGSKSTAARPRTRRATTSRPARAEASRPAAGGVPAPRPSDSSPARGSSANPTTCCSANDRPPTVPPLGKPPDGGRKAADLYARLLAAEPHATAGRKHERGQRHPRVVPAGHRDHRSMAAAAPGTSLRRPQALTGLVLEAEPGAQVRRRPDRKITYRKWARGSGPGLVRRSGLVRDGMGQGVLVRFTSKPRAWIWRMWLRSLRSRSMRVW